MLRQLGHILAEMWRRVRSVYVSVEIGPHSLWGASHNRAWGWYSLSLGRLWIECDFRVPARDWWDAGLCGEDAPWGWLWRCGA